MAKSIAFVKLTSISILALPLASCVTLGDLFNCLNLCFLICMMGELIFPYLTGLLKNKLYTVCKNFNKKPSIE